jgi:hypothetical protein
MERSRHARGTEHRPSAELGSCADAAFPIRDSSNMISPQLAHDHSLAGRLPVAVVVVVVRVVEAIEP